MADTLLWRTDMEALLTQLGGTQTVGRTLPLACHAGAGVLAGVHKDVPAHPGQAVLHLRCGQCRSAVYDIAVKEPVMTPKRCAHRAPLDVGYFRGEVFLLCRRCDRAHLVVTPARPPRGLWWAPPSRA